MRLSELSNEQVVESLKALVGEGNRLVAKVVAYLVEVEDRRIHLELACSSMFDFCTRKLGFSEGEAFRRITAARLARRFPRVIEAIASGRVHLSSLVLLRDHFSEDNVDVLLERAAGRSKREIEELVARLAPKPDVASSIRKMPERLASPAPSALPAQSALPIHSTLPVPSALPIHSTLPLQSTLPEKSTLPVQSALPRQSTLAVQITLPPESAVPVQSTPPGERALQVQPLAAPAPRSQVQPLSEARYRVQLTASARFRDKLEHARRLLSHRHPSGDLAVVVEEALDLLIGKLEKVKLGRTERPRAAPSQHAPKDPARVTSSARREVAARDGLRCAFIGTNGERCPSREFLEFDHRTPRAIGGSGEAANVRLLCRAHNRLAAERVFGRAYVAERIDLRQEKCGTGVETKERVRSALRAMGFRTAEAERAVMTLDPNGWDDRPIEILVREAIGVIT